MPSNSHNKTLSACWFGEVEDKYLSSLTQHTFILNAEQFWRSWVHASQTYFQVQCYTIYLFLWNLFLWNISISSTTVAGSSKGLTKYVMLYILFELLMMGGGTAWNM